MNISQPNAANLSGKPSLQNLGINTNTSNNGQPCQIGLKSLNLRVQQEGQEQQKAPSQHIIYSSVAIIAT